MTDDSNRPGVDACGHSTSGAPDKPLITLVPGALHVSVSETRDLLAATGSYFSRGSTIVRVYEVGGGGVTVQPLHEQTLALLLAQIARFGRPKNSGLIEPCDPGPQLIQALLHGQDHRLPELAGVARQPYFHDGRLVTVPGYHQGSGIYGGFDPSAFNLGGDREYAQACLDYLASLLQEFEWLSEHDRSAALCAILTATVRSTLKVAPAFNFTATGPGSGKSYLAEIVALFAGPEEPYRPTYPDRGDEAAKLMLTLLRESPSAVVFDDMQGNWKPFGPINRALTSPTITDRVLGKSEAATVSTRVLMIGTGNGIEPLGDLRRRVVSVRLAPASEAPALRRFKFDPAASIRMQRAPVVGCALSIINAYLAAGAPAQDVVPIGTYDQWSTFCRFPLIWMGLPDPAQSLIDQLSHDPDRDALAELMHAWHNVFGSHSVTVRRLLSTDDRALKEALDDLPAMEGGAINPNKLGWYFRRIQGRRINAMRIEPGDSSERKSWRVIVE